MAGRGFNMQVQLCGNTRERLVEEAQGHYPDECCGVLLGHRANFEVLDFRPLENTAAGACAHFRISPLELYRVEREIEDGDLEIVGFYHSHPDCEAVLSREDREYMVPELVYIILSVVSGRVVDIKSYRKNQ